MQIKKRSRKNTTALAFGTLALLVTSSFAFVTLDTSENLPDPPEQAEDTVGTSLPKPPEQPEPHNTAAVSVPDSGAQKALPGSEHHGNVLFLSSDNWLLFTQLGALQAMRDYGLEPDVVLAEGISALLGAAWAVDYPLDELGVRLLERDPGYYFRPLERVPPTGPADFFRRHGRPQLEYRLGNISGSGENLRLGTRPSTLTSEHVHAAWLMAQVSHEAPGGPVDRLEHTRRKLYLQMTDTRTGDIVTAGSGSLQELLKASVLPSEWVRERQYRSFLTSGSLVSGNMPILRDSAFTFDRLLIVDFRSGSGAVPGFSHGDPPWIDSLNQQVKRRSSQQSWSGNEDKILEIPVIPPLDSAERLKPEAWRMRGYVAVLEMMDVLRAVLGKKEGDGKTMASARLPLGIEHVSVDELASGGRQLLLDMLQRESKKQTPELNRVAMESLAFSGFYSNLDVSWVRDSVIGRSSLLFEGMEKSKITLQGGGNWLSGRNTQAFGRLTWAEPFYVPFVVDGALALGGRGSGYGGQVFAHPLHPVTLQFGVRRYIQEWLHPEPTRALRKLGAISTDVKLDQGELFLRLFPDSPLEFSTQIARVEILYKDEDVEIETPEILPILVIPSGSYLSTDFTQEIRIRSPKDFLKATHQFFLRYKHRNPEILFGAPKPPSQVREAGVDLHWGDWAMHGHYYWSDLDPVVKFPPEILVLGEAQALSFQNTAMMLPFLSEYFLNARVNWRPTWKRWTLLLGVGAFERLGDGMEKLHAQHGMEITPRQYYWETGLDWASPAGPVRAGLGGLNQDSPYLYVQFGVGIDLPKALSSSSL